MYVRMSSSVTLYPKHTHNWLPKKAGILGVGVIELKQMEHICKFGMPEESSAV